MCSPSPPPPSPSPPPPRCAMRAVLRCAVLCCAVRAVHCGCVSMLACRNVSIAGSQPSSCLPLLCSPSPPPPSPSPPPPSPSPPPPRCAAPAVLRCAVLRYQHFHTNSHFFYCVHHRQPKPAARLPPLLCSPSPPPPSPSPPPPSPSPPPPSPSPPPPRCLLLWIIRCVCWLCGCGD